MNTQSTLRFGGIAAIISALLYVGSMVLWMGAGDAGAPPMAATCTRTASSPSPGDALVPVRPAPQRVGRASLAALFLLGISMVASLFVDPTDITNPTVIVLTICYGLGALLLGWLAWRSPRLPSGVGVVAMLMGVLTLAMLVPMAAGAADPVGIANLVVGVLYVVWLLWLGWIFSSRAAPARCSLPDSVFTDLKEGAKLWSSIFCFSFCSLHWPCCAAGSRGGQSASAGCGEDRRRAAGLLTVLLRRLPSPAAAGSLPPSPARRVARPDRCGYAGADVAATTWSTSRASAVTAQWAGRQPNRAAAIDRRLEYRRPKALAS